MLRLTGAIVIVIAVLANVLFFRGGPQRTAPSPVAYEGDGFAITGVTLFDGERFLKNMNVLVEDGVVVSVSDAAPVAEAEFIYDGRGKFLVPGFVDAHVHIIDPSCTELEDAARFGVTAVFDQYMPLETLAACKETGAAAIKTRRATLYSAGTLVTSPGGHGTQFGMDVPTIVSPNEAAQFVAARLSEGSDWIKIVFEPTAGVVTSIDAETLKAVVAAAHAQDALAVVHISTKEAARQAVEAGADGLVHVFADEVADQSLIDLMRERRVFVVATLSTVQAFSSAARENLAEDAALAPFLRQAQRDGLGAAYDVESGDKSAYDLDTALTNVRLLHEAGIAIVAGTDAPNPGTAFGASLHGELALLASAGMTPQAALRAATSAAAGAFRIGGRGRIRAGSPADLVLLRGDPAQDVRATRAIVRVWKNGYELERKTFAQDLKGGRKPALDDGIISAFDDGGPTSALGATWEANTDEMLGGNSTAAVTWRERGDDEGAGLLNVAGVISNKSPWPWSGAALSWGSTPETSYDFSKYTDLVFEAKGVPRRYSVFITTRTSARMPASRSIELTPEWREYRLALSDFRGAASNAVYGVTIAASGRPAGPFEFQIDNVRLE